MSFTTIKTFFFLRSHSPKMYLCKMDGNMHFHLSQRKCPVILLSIPAVMEAVAAAVIAGTEASDPEQEPISTPAAVSDDEPHPNTGRTICWSGCGRPSTVCLCPHLPPSPIPTSTRLLILHHPHSLRRNPLATVPLLTRCLLHTHAIPGRRLRPTSSPLLASPTLLYLFPGGTPITHWLHSTPPAARPNPVLIVFDGTWQHANEMVAASLPFLSESAQRVSIGECDETVEGDSKFDSELVLRKEPFRGCVSTMEAVARALRVLEPDGDEVEERLLGVLRAMARFQAQHLKPVKPRPKLRKKKKEEVGKAMEANKVLDEITEPSPVKYQ